MNEPLSRISQESTILIDQVSAFCFREMIVFPFSSPFTAVGMLLYIGKVGS